MSVAGPETELLQAAPLPAGPALLSRGAVLAGMALGAGLLAASRLLPPSSDVVPPDEVTRRQAAVLAAVPIRLRALSDQEARTALAALALPDGQRTLLLSLIGPRAWRFAEIAVFDADAEDGDVVRIGAAGLFHTVRLTHRPVAVPVVVAGNGRVEMTGVDEGTGGGVTVGILAQGKSIRFPPIPVGKTISVPVVAVDAP